jgi:hypothetical protein
MRAFEAFVLRLEERAQDVHHAPAGGFFAAGGAAEGDGLAGHDAQFLVTDHHAVGVEDPGHDLRIGAGVGRGDVVLRGR